jgi:hypothetical protein
VGRLQTDADRERVLDGLGGSGSNDGPSKSELANVVKKLAPRWFLMRDAHARDGIRLLQPRWAMSLLLGPMTRSEIRRALGKDEADCAPPPPLLATTSTQPQDKP